MKYLIVILLISAINLTASIESVEQKIYASVLKALYGNDKRVAVWTDDQEKRVVLYHINNVKVVKDPQKADILFVYHNMDINSKKPIFVGSYRLLKHYKDQAIGGFYWQKGRPNLLFLGPNLQKLGMHVDKTLKQYIDEGLE